MQAIMISEALMQDTSTYTRNKTEKFAMATSSSQCQSNFDINERGFLRSKVLDRVRNNDLGKDKINDTRVNDINAECETEEKYDEEIKKAKHKEQMQLNKLNISVLSYYNEKWAYASKRKKSIEDLDKQFKHKIEEVKNSNGLTEEKRADMLKCIEKKYSNKKRLLNKKYKTKIKPIDQEIEYLNKHLKAKIKNKTKAKIDKIKSKHENPRKPFVNHLLSGMCINLS